MQTLDIKGWLVCFEIIQRTQWFIFKPAWFLRVNHPADEYSLISEMIYSMICRWPCWRPRSPSAWYSGAVEEMHSGNLKYVPKARRIILSTVFDSWKFCFRLKFKVGAVFYQFFTAYNPWGREIRCLFRCTVTQSYVNHTLSGGFSHYYSRKIY